MNTHEKCKHWILEDTRQNPEEETLLKQHLTECSECWELKKNLTLCENLMHHAPMVKPAEGFTARFHAMAAERSKQPLKSPLLPKKKIYVIAGLVCLMNLFTSIIMMIFSGDIVDLFIQLIKELSSLSATIERFSTTVSVFRQPLLYVGIGAIVLMMVYLLIIILSAFTLANARNKGEEKI